MSLFYTPSQIFPSAPNLFASVPFSDDKNLHLPPPATKLEEKSRLEIGPQRRRKQLRQSQHDAKNLIKGNLLCFQAWPRAGADLGLGSKARAQELGSR